MSKYVIFKENGVYKMTDIENYRARIRNANSIIICADCQSFEDAVSCFASYSNIEFIDATGD